MDIGELKTVIDKEQIPAYLYEIEGGGETDNRYCLSKEKGKWLVFMTMDGKRYGERKHLRESSACKDLYKRLKAAHKLVLKEEARLRKKAEREARQ